MVSPGLRPSNGTDVSMDPLAPAIFHDECLFECSIVRESERGDRRTGSGSSTLLLLLDLLWVPLA